MTTQRAPGTVRVIGIDPGFASIGACGMCLRRVSVRLEFMRYIGTKPTAPRVRRRERMSREADEMRRLDEIVDQLAELLDQYQPDLVATERRPRLRNVAANAQCAMMYGALRALVHVRRIPWLSFEPEAIKQRATGNPNADKTAVVQALRSLAPTFKDWPSPRQLEHAADAGGAALCADTHPLVEQLRKRHGSRV